MSGRPGVVVPDWQLERYRLGELPPSEQEAVRAALAVDAELRARAAALELSDAEILAVHAPATMAGAIRARAEAAPAEEAPAAPVRPPRGVTAPTLVSLAALGVLLVTASAILGPRPLGRDAADVTRVKGLAPRLYVFRKGPAAAEPLASGAVAHESDVVQLAYQAAGRRFGAIVSIDGRHVVTRHLPVAGQDAAPLAGGPPVALAQAYRLDDAPGFERFYLVTADAPFAVEEVIAAVLRSATPGGPTGGARLDLPPSLDQFVFVLEKEAKR
jgi:anti-sigma factor RsiW